MKWFLKVCIAHSAALTRWLLGSTNWTVPFCCCMKSLMGSAAWLSVTLNVGLYPWVVRVLEHLLERFHNVTV